MDGRSLGAARPTCWAASFSRPPEHLQGEGLPENRLNLFKPQRRGEPEPLLHPCRKREGLVHRREEGRCSQGPEREAREGEATATTDHRRPRGRCGPGCLLSGLRLSL